MSTTVRRPSTVTLVVALIVILGVSDVLVGIVAMTAVKEVDLSGIVLIALGLVYLAVAKGLIDGRNWARIVAAAGAALQVVLAIIKIFTADSSSRASAVDTAGIVGIIILAILFSAKANAFFGSQSS